MFHFSQETNDDDTLKGTSELYFCLFDIDLF